MRAWMRRDGRRRAGPAADPCQRRGAGRGLPPVVYRLTARHDLSGFLLDDGEGVLLESRGRPLITFAPGACGHRRTRSAGAPGHFGPARGSSPMPQPASPVSKTSSIRQAAPSSPAPIAAHASLSVLAGARIAQTSRAATLRVARTRLWRHLEPPLPCGGIRLPQLRTTLQPSCCGDGCGREGRPQRRLHSRKWVASLSLREGALLTFVPGQLRLQESDQKHMQGAKPPPSAHIRA
jgi:hypothetical protein